MRSALYLRPSVTGSWSIDRLKQEVTSRGWIPMEEFLEEGESPLGKRPALRELLAAAGRRRRPFDAVVLQHLDHAFRSADDIALTAHRLHDLGIHLVALADDWPSPGGELDAIRALALVGKVHREQHTRRTHLGVVRARSRGNHPGRPRASIPVARAIELRQSGKSLRAIANELEVSLGALHRTLVPKTPSRVRSVTK